MSGESIGKAFTETPVVFECEGSRLLGMVHQPTHPRERGLLIVVAGGPQYRGGLARVQVRLARRLAANGVPVMRFDYRGLGDSEGQFRGFRQVEADIAAALRVFMDQVPGMREVALWGGCDASSASLINGWKFPQVQGLLLGNPWVHSEETSDKVAVAHFRQRLRDVDFWLKLLRGGYNPLPALGTLMRTLLKSLQRAVGAGSKNSADLRAAEDDITLPFQERMRLGMARFQGDVLLVMSGRSLVSREFDQLVTQSPAWQLALASPSRIMRIDLPEADQAYSNMASQGEVIDLITRWMCEPGRVQGHSGAAAVLDAARIRISAPMDRET